MIFTNFAQENSFLEIVNKKCDNVCHQGLNIMAIQNSEITTENVLGALVEMPEKDFEQVVNQAKELRNEKESFEENDLIHRINTIFSPEKRQRYNELYARFKSKNLSEDENAELLELSDEFEILNAKRLEYIGKLATLRGQSFKDLINDLGIKS